MTAMPVMAAPNHFFVSRVLCTMRQVAKMLDARARANMCFLEYTVQKPDEDQLRHFLSAVSLGYSGR